MSFVELRIELPAYSHSFIILAQGTTTIAQVKEEIQKHCPGGPRVDGQRVISRGRYLLDHETVNDLWKSPDEPRIIHLAVHPSAWSSSPPPRPVQRLSPPNYPPAPSLPHAATTAQQNPTSLPYPNNFVPLPHPLTYILSRHQTALASLSLAFQPDVSSQFSPELLRSMSIQAVEAYGWIWPSILDEEFPLAAPGGLNYNIVTIEGRSYLSLAAPRSPTVRQTHALKVLSYTFTLLAIPISNVITTPTIVSQTVPFPPNVNQFLQQLDLGFPQAFAARNAAQIPPNPLMPGLRDMPLRPLFAPVVFLLFRTLLLLYFVSPTRNPTLSILITFWMLCELWRPIRHAFFRPLQVAADNNPGQNAHPPQANGGDQPAQDVPVGGDLQIGINGPAYALLDLAANQNIRQEEEILNDVSGTNAPEPHLRHKLTTFFSLLFTTMDPAVWNRRRAALGRREGRIRTEASLRNSQPVEGEAEDENRVRMRAELARQHSQRPGWVREYIERVVVGDWVDDSD